MNKWPLWAVLAPGNPAQLESRARAIVMTEEEEEDGEELPFEISPGRESYHAIVGTGSRDIGAEMQIAEQLSLECDERVYSIERANDPCTVMSWRHGVPAIMDVGPESLAKSLGCPLPGSEDSSNRSASKPLRHAASGEGVGAHEALGALEEDYGEPLPPGHYRIEETPRGFRLSNRVGDIGFADIVISERIPGAIVYGVIASPCLDVFVVNILRAGECIGQFAQPPRENSFMPAVREVKGERSPKQILAALGIPAEWFLNE